MSKSGVTMKLFVVNVGVNSKDVAERKLKSPVFADGRFEFIPIKESNADSRYSELKYRDIECFNDRNRNISEYFEIKKLADYYVHNDPEFRTFTYGDIDTPRSSNLRYAIKGDKILFLARLFDHDGEKYTGKGRFYFIGIITVEENLYFDLKKKITPEYEEGRVCNNAHYRKFKNGCRSNFRLITGTKDSSFRFRKALEVTPEIATLLFNGKYEPETDGFTSNDINEPVKNKNGNLTKFKNFHSNTRPIQIYLDSGKNNSEKESLDKLLRIAVKHQ